MSAAFGAQSPHVANMPTAAAAMTAVASQPRLEPRTQRELAHDLLTGPEQHDHHHDRHRRDAVDDGAPKNRALMLSSGVKFSTAPTIVAAAITP
jgi:hypothetical protein